MGNDWGSSNSIVAARFFRVPRDLGIDSHLVGVSPNFHCLSLLRPAYCSLSRCVANIASSPRPCAVARLISRAENTVLNRYLWLSTDNDHDERRELGAATKEILKLQTKKLG